jgi:peptidoglycan/LPS O-acetylase OafA/YrhL
MAENGQPGNKKTINDTSKASGRIQGLDGLRAFAVLSVLGFHLWPDMMPGGFLGVDVFFVISGFLITTLLLRERERAGRINLAAFWKRRARRLLPALFVVVTVSIGSAWAVNRELLVNIERQTIEALTFSTNWGEIFAGSDYFAGSDQSLFVTFWSLAVEEQFYLVWPLLLVAGLALTASREKLALAAAAVSVGSALLMAVLFDPALSTTRIYYGTDTHAFGLMMGVALAFAFSTPIWPHDNRFWQRMRPIFGIVAVVCLTALVILINSSEAITYRGGMFLGSALSGVCVAVLPGEATWFTSLCCRRPLAWLGERSYGIYLWHWPVLMVIGASKAVAPVGMSWTLIAAVVAVTLALSEMSYRWIEMPVRENGFRASWSAVRESFRMPHAWLRGPGIAAAAVLVIMTTASIGFFTAPDKSQEQLSIEAGERAMAERSELIPAASSLQPVVAEAAEEKNAPAWPRELEVPPGDHIVALGDSVMSGAAPAIYDRFPGIYINAKPSLQWHDAPAMVENMIANGTMRSVVLLNFGTNAGFKEPQSEQALRQILDRLGSRRRVVLVNTVGYSYWIPASNETLRSISADYPNTVVADWHSVIEGQPGLLHRDKTHPNDAGIIVYANVLADALKSLGPG